MGMFKDMRDLSKTGKQMKKERGGSLKMMKDGLAQANQMVQEVQADQELAEKLANEGVDGTATIISMQATGANDQHAARAPVPADRRRRRQPVAPSPTPRSSPPPMIGQLQPGAQVPVKVDPNDHSQLMIGLAG